MLKELLKQRWAGISVKDWAVLAAALLASWLLGFVIVRGVDWLAHRLPLAKHLVRSGRLMKALRRPVRLFLTLLVFELALGNIDFPRRAQPTIETITSTLLILAATWFVANLVQYAGESYTQGLAEVPGDSVRGTKTRATVARQLGTVITWVVGIALVLLQFQAVRRLGVSLLASAGLAGIVLGVAAQKSLASLIAGIQISIAEPIRIGDTVLVENEYGIVEEISLTYVVVKLWDQRRLVLPVTYFLEKPFENWTRGSTNITGVVTLHADYRTPVDKVRAKLLEICKADETWDGEVATLVVLDSTQETIVLRATVSAAQPPLTWNLRCHVREQLIAYLRDLDGGAYLPRRRIVTSERAAPEPT